VPDLVSPSYFPAIAAVELGLFQRHGLAATLEPVFPVTRAYEEFQASPFLVTRGQQELQGRAGGRSVEARGLWRVAG
jgi:hypothetical protein